MPELEKGIPDAVGRVPAGELDKRLHDALAEGTPGVVALDFGPQFRGRSRYTALRVGCTPVAAAEAGAGAEEIIEVLKTVAAGAEAGCFGPAGIAGFLSYDAKHILEPAAPQVHQTRHPLLRFVSLDGGLIADRAEPEAGRGAGTFPCACGATHPELTAGISRRRVTLKDCGELSRAQYADRIHAIQRDIQAGEYYELNFTQRFRVRSAAPPGLVALRLRLTAAAPYWAFMDFGDLAVISASPELFLRRTGARVETRPIKGSLRRGSDSRQDAAHVEHLRRDPKNAAEHTMVVDLARNDLGRVCEYGSVKTVKHAAVETFPAVHHLVSTIVGQLCPGVQFVELLAASFPPASITGAPKIRVMQAIDEYEISPRGLYTGTIGRLGPGGDLDLNVAIRTIVATRVNDREYDYEFGAGGAVVADSDADEEYEECLLKAEPLLDSILAAEAVACSGPE